MTLCRLVVALQCCVQACNYLVAAVAHNVGYALMVMTPAPCYLGLCLSDSKADLNNVMLSKATKAAYALKLHARQYRISHPPKYPLCPTHRANPPLRCRKMAQAGPTATYASLTTQLPTEQVYKDMVYAHYSLHISTPTLAVRAELGAYPTNIPGIVCLSNYMSYLCSPEVPPLVSKALLVLKAIALTSKFSWWE